MQKDAPQSAGESSHFGRLNAVELSPLQGSVMTFCYRWNLDIKCSKVVSFIFCFTIQQVGHVRGIYILRMSSQS